MSMVALAGFGTRASVTAHIPMSCETARCLQFQGGFQGKKYLLMGECCICRRLGISDRQSVELLTSRYTRIAQHGHHTQRYVKLSSWRYVVDIGL